MRYSLLLLCLLLQACSPAQKSLVDSFKIALVGQQNVVISQKKINAIPYGSIYLHLPNTPQIFVVGYNDDGLEKWITSDQVVFITQNGRLVRSAAYPQDNLLEVSNLQQDPLLHASQLQDGAAWTRLMRWTENNQPLSSIVTSRFALKGNEVLNLFGKRIACQVWRENLTLKANGYHWQNTFWVDPTSGLVVKSNQTLGAIMPVSITLLKPADPEIP